MKNIILLLPVLLFFTFCKQAEIKQEENSTPPDQSIIGTWQLIEVYDNPGDGSGGWYSVENGYTYTFFSNKTFTSTELNICTTGIYSIRSNEVVLGFDCEQLTVGIESPEDIFIERIRFESGDIIIMNPIKPTCDEGCARKFRKINSEGEERY